MSKAEASDGDIRVIPGHSGRSGFKRFVVTVLILFVIAWITLFFAVRTAGGRVLIQDHIESRFGITVTVEKASLGFPFVLILENVQSEEDEAARSGFRVNEVRISVGISPRWRMTMTNPELNLLYERGVGWLPAAFGEIGDLPGQDIRQVSRLSAELRNRVIVRIKDGNICWWDAAGNEMASSRGIQFAMAPAKVPDNAFFYYSLAMHMGVGPADGLFKEVKNQWLSSEKHDFIEISRSESLPPDSDPGFWGTQP